MIEEFREVKKVWHKIDAWRGYYTYEVPDVKEASGTEIAKIDLSYIARGPEDNERYLKMSKDWLRKFFKIRKRILRGSNVFAQNVALLLKPKEPHTWEQLRDIASEFQDKYVDFYTRAFSIFTGETYPIDFVGFKNTLNQLETRAKEKLKEVV